MSQSGSLRSRAVVLEKLLMKPKILLVNPPIYDFAAYDFWLKPHGMLNVAGILRPIADLYLFDTMDRLAPQFDPEGVIKTTEYNTGPYPFKKIPNPESLKDIPRYFRRYGIQNLLKISPGTFGDMVSRDRFLRNFSQITGRLILCSSRP
jgi:hypothetical protein